MSHLLPNLATPVDLFKKAEAEFQQLMKTPDDVYLAFNLLVTLEHLPDWLGLRHLVDENHTLGPELRAISHLANGSKHFELTKKEKMPTGEKKDYHRSVLDVRMVESPPGSLYRGYIGVMLGENRPVLHVDIRDIGYNGVEFWRPHVAAWAAANAPAQEAPPAEAGPSSPSATTSSWP